MEKLELDNAAEEIRAQARRVAAQAARLPLGAILEWIEKGEEYERLMAFSEWLE